MSNITTLKLNSTDISRFTELIYLFERVFEMDDFQIPKTAHLQHLLKKDDFMVFVAIKNDQVVGGLTAHVLDQYYNTKKLAYLYDLAVEKDLQRQGIGKKLIQCINEYCTKNNFEEVFLQADLEDDHAIDFYRKTNSPLETNAIQFAYILN